MTLRAIVIGLIIGIAAAATLRAVQHRHEETATLVFQAKINATVHGFIVVQDDGTAAFYDKAGNFIEVIDAHEPLKTMFSKCTPIAYPTPPSDGFLNLPTTFTASTDHVCIY